MKALLLIDIQQDFFLGGAMPLEGSVEVARHAGVLLDCCRIRRLPVVHIQHFSGNNEVDYLQLYTGGTELHPSVLPHPGKIIFQKTQPDSFYGTFLEDYLQAIDVDHLVLAGMTTNMCLNATLHSAHVVDLKCTLVHDACTTQGIRFGDIDVPADKVLKTYVDMLDRYTLTRVCSTKSLCNQLMVSAH